MELRLDPRCVTPDVRHERRQKGASFLTSARWGWQKAAVALTNKNARILWAVMTKGERFDAQHVSVKPGAPPQTAAA